MTLKSWRENFEANRTIKKKLKGVIKRIQQFTSDLAAGKLVEGIDFAYVNTCRVQWAVDQAHPNRVIVSSESLDVLKRLYAKLVAKVPATYFDPRNEVIYVQT